MSTPISNTAGSRPAWGARLLAAVGLGAALWTLALPAVGQTGPQPKLPTVTLQAGIHLIRAEVAREMGTRAMGLMFRERLGPNEGMLFVFPEAGRHCFWMRNTPLPLSIAFIDDAGRIVNIEHMAPRTEDSHCPAQPVRYALEMEQGWFGKRGLAPGAQFANGEFFKARAAR